MSSGELSFSSVNEVLTHFDKSATDAEKAIATYRSQIKELTGHDPDKPLTALDVVKIVHKVFFKCRPVQ